MTTDISVGVRWDPIKQEEVIEDFDYDGGNSSSRLFERSRIKALAGEWQLGLRPEGGGRFLLETFVVSIRLLLLVCLS